MKYIADQLELFPGVYLGKIQVQRQATHKKKGLTVDPYDPDIRRGIDTQPIAQHDKYLVLADEKREKFVRSVRQTYTHLTCHTDTTMSLAIAETYATNPKFYGATYCCCCKMHLPVDEFVWRGTNEKVGS